jgi:hypothetical protein
VVSDIPRKTIMKGTYIGILMAGYVKTFHAVAIFLMFDDGSVGEQWEESKISEG